MSIYKYLFFMSLGLLTVSCGSEAEEETSPYSLELSRETYQLGDQINAQVVANKQVDSIIYLLGDQRLQNSVGNQELDHVFRTEKLGEWDLTARIFSGGRSVEVARPVTLFNNAAPKAYTYEVIDTYPHATDAYTQGLEFYQGELFESTGHYGTSSLRKVDLQTGEVLEKIDIPDAYFAEGLTVLDDKIYQLTWKEDKGFIYDAKTFQKIGEFPYGQSKEGWGLTNDGEQLYKSDGTQRIWILNSETLAEEEFIQTLTHKTVASKLNELEWIDGKIYANTYQKDGVAIINPENGAIEGVIDFSGLRELIGNQEDLDPVNDVLNGIAYDPKNEKLYVTGKNWDTIFEVEIMEK